MKFDEFLFLINDWGKYQKTKYLLICLSYMLPSIMVYQYSFTAAIPSFRCFNPQSQSNDQFNEEMNEIYFKENFQPNKNECELFHEDLSLKECQRCFIRRQIFLNQSKEENSLEKCEKFVYDRKYYQNTLTEEWEMICDRIIYRSSIQMIFFVGYMIGSILFGILADQYGRRLVMSWSFLLMTISSLICSFGPQENFGFWRSYLLFVFGRFLLACSTRGISVSGFVLGSEIVGPKRRLLTGIVIEYFFAFGQMILLIFAYSIRTWRKLTLSISLFTIPFLFFYFFLPESPRWLLSKGKFDQLEEILKKIAKTNERFFDQNSFEQLKKEQEVQMKNAKKNSQGIRSLFQSKSMSMISLNLFFQWLVQNLVFYGVSQNTGSWELNPYLSFGLSALVELFAYIIVHLILDRLGRKRPYYSFVFLFSFTAFLILPIEYFFSSNSSVQKILMNLINIILKLSASASYSIIYIYANELFPTNVRNTGMGICSMVARIGAILGTFSNDYLSRIWINLPIVVYACFSLFAGFFSLVFPETLNYSLPQTVQDVEMMILNQRIPRKEKTSSQNYEEDQVTRF